MDSDERGMNPVAMTIYDQYQEHWPSRGSNQRLLFSSLQRYRLSYEARPKSEANKELQVSRILNIVKIDTV